MKEYPWGKNKNPIKNYSITSLKSLSLKDNFKNEIIKMNEKFSSVIDYFFNEQDCCKELMECKPEIMKQVKKFKNLEVISLYSENGSGFYATKIVNIKDVNDSIRKPLKELFERVGIFLYKQGYNIVEVCDTSYTDGISLSLESIDNDDYFFNESNNKTSLKLKMISDKTRINELNESKSDIYSQLNSIIQTLHISIDNINIKEAHDRYDNIIMLSNIQMTALNNPHEFKLGLFPKEYDIRMTANVVKHLLTLKRSELMDVLRKILRYINDIKIGRFAFFNQHIPRALKEHNSFDAFYKYYIFKVCNIELPRPFIDIIQNPMALNYKSTMNDVRTVFNAFYDNENNLNNALSILNNDINIMPNNIINDIIEIITNPELIRESLNKIHYQTLDEITLSEITLEGIRVRKLKKIPKRVVTYINIEAEAIQNTNDKAMLAAYASGKLEIAEFYASVLQNNTPGYVVPHTLQELQWLIIELRKSIDRVMSVRVPMGPRPLISVAYPDGYMG